MSMIFSYEDICTSFFPHTLKHSMCNLTCKVSYVNESCIFVDSKNFQDSFTNQVYFHFKNLYCNCLYRKTFKYIFNINSVRAINIYNVHEKT